MEHPLPMEQQARLLINDHTDTLSELFDADYEDQEARRQTGRLDGAYDWGEDLGAALARTGVEPYPFYRGLDSDRRTHRYIDQHGWELTWIWPYSIHTYKSDNGERFAVSSDGDLWHNPSVTTLDKATTSFKTRAVLRKAGLSVKNGITIPTPWRPDQVMGLISDMSAVEHEAYDSTESQRHRRYRRRRSLAVAGLAAAMYHPEGAIVRPGRIQVPHNLQVPNCY